MSVDVATRKIHHLYRSYMKAWKMKVNLRLSKAFAMQSERFELKKPVRGVTVPMILQMMKISMKASARVMDMIENSIGKSVNFTRMYTFLMRTKAYPMRRPPRMAQKMSTASCLP